MANALLIAVFIEGILLLCLAAAVLAHSRLLGLLHMRLGPAGARPLADGPVIGTPVGMLTGKRIDGREWHLTFPRAEETVLVFVSPQCETCNALMPHVKDFLRRKDVPPLWLVSTVDHVPMNQAYIAYRRIEGIPYVLGENLSETLNIEATPYALRLDAAGVVRAKGIVNNHENLLSLSRHDQPAAALEQEGDGRPRPRTGSKGEFDEQTVSAG